MRARRITTTLGLLAALGAALITPAGAAHAADTDPVPPGALLQGLPQQCYHMLDANPTKVEYLEGDCPDSEAAGGARADKCRIGIIYAKVNGITYHDIAGGEGRIDGPDTAALYRDMLLGPAKHDGPITNLGYWATLAYSVFKEHSKQTFTYNENQTFDQYFGGSPDRAGRTDLIWMWQQERPAGNPSVKKDGKRDETRYSGLQQAVSLAAARQALGDQIADTVHSLTDKQGLTGSDVLTMSGKQDRLTKMTAASTGPVFFTHVTTDHSPTANEHLYKGLGLAFYDFKLAILGDDIYPPEIDPITAVEGYETFSNAVDDKASGVSRAPGAVAPPVAKTTYNLDRNDTVHELTYQVGTDYATTNEVTHSHDMNFDSRASLTINAGGSFKNDRGYPRFTMTGEVTYGELWGESVMSGSSLTRNLSVEAKDTRPVPAHTQVTTYTTPAMLTETFDYDAPMIITFKVAMYGLSGKLYDDGTKNEYFQTAQYEQTEFTTLLGAVSGSAHVDLAHRIANGGVYDFADDGFTYGQFRKFGTNQDQRVNRVNWAGVATSAAVSSRATLADELPQNMLVSNQPMAALGGVMGSTVVEYTTVVSPAVPVYPIDTIRFTDKLTQQEVKMPAGSTISLNGRMFDLEAVNMEDVPFHGFQQSRGTWNKVADTDLITVTTDKTTGLPTITASANTGDVLLQYVIDKDYYQYRLPGTPGGPPRSAEFVNAGDLTSTAYIKVVITKEPFAASFKGSNRFDLGASFDLNDPEITLLTSFDDDGIPEVIDRDAVTWKLGALESPITIADGHDAKCNELGSVEVKAFYHDDDEALRLTSEFLDVECALRCEFDKEQWADDPLCAPPDVCPFNSELLLDDENCVAPPPCEHDQELATDDEACVAPEPEVDLTQFRRFADWSGFTFPVLEHFGTWNGVDSVSARIDKEHSCFAQLRGQLGLINPEHVTVTPGSTVITLQPAYLRTLAPGDHAFVIDFALGASAEVHLNIPVFPQVPGNPLPPAAQPRPAAAATNNAPLTRTGPAFQLLVAAGAALAAALPLFANHRRG